MTWLRYVLHADVPAYEAKGWKLRSNLGHHGHYSVLMIWEGEHEPA